MTFEPTEEQAAIVEAARNTSDNLIIHALAGAAKTSTLVLIAKALPTIPTLCLAFNVRIKDELKDRLPGNCECLTLNSVGHRAWNKATGRRNVVKTSKSYDIVKKIIDGWVNRAEQAELYSAFSDILQYLAHGKRHGWVPNGKFDLAKPLHDDEEFFASLPEEPSEVVMRVLRTAMYESIAQSLKGEIDYDDQIYMPTIFHGSFPAYPLVLVDETQDLSELNHAMLKKLVKNRIMAVGDENQSIYAFRGAHANSMELMAATFNMKKMYLSTSFRCPQKVVLEARTRAPSMQWPTWAKEGTVAHLPAWSIEVLPPDCTILCRNNAPLFSLAMRLIANGRFPELVGADIGKKLIKVMEKLGPESTPRDGAFALLGDWRERKLSKSREPGAIEDQYECMAVFIRKGKTLGEAVVYAQHLLSVSGNIKMMSVHKAKGLEWDNIFLLDRGLIRVEHTQEANLLYVGQTRSKDSLTYITSEGFQGE